MNHQDKLCPICQSDQLSLISGTIYHRCHQCFHQVTFEMSESIPIVNETFSVEEMKDLNSLDQFKKKVAFKVDSIRSLAVDIGCGAGRFLYHLKETYKKCCGVEISEEPRNFANDKLGLEVRPSLSDLDLSQVSLLSMWHSLEHIPVSVSQDILKQAPQAPLIISVPNGESLQFKMFSARWPYYDKYSHIHQFSSQSLDRFLDDHGYQLEERFYSFAYSVFGYLQGFLNFFNREHNYFYYRKKRGWSYNRSSLVLTVHDFYNYLLILPCLGPSFILALYDYVCEEKSGVITRCYRKRH